MFLLHAALSSFPLNFAPLPLAFQVLFCTLSREQRDLYRGYLGSKDLKQIFSGSRTALAGIDVLRKVGCWLGTEQIIGCAFLWCKGGQEG